MTLDDILYLIANSNRPGRSTLVGLRSTIFDSGAVTVVAGSANVDLPSPTPGFVRRWEHVTATPSAVVNNDVLFLIRIVKDQTNGVVLLTQMFQGATLVLPIALIGGKTELNGFSNQNQVSGIDPFYNGQDDFLRVSFQPTAPVAQTVRVFGFYQDVPI